jgi:GNAT superfamily N-acetyltransferase
MPAVTIRPATPDDRDALERVIADCYAAVYPGWYDADVLAEAMPAMLKIDPALLASGRYFVASAGPSIAGCGGWSTQTPGNRAEASGTGHIRHFATDPGFMRRGVGGAILDRCINDARAAGIVTMRCFSSLPAEAFYARHGFKRIDTVNVMLGDSASFGAVLMEKKLA